MHRGLLCARRVRRAPLVRVLGTYSTRIPLVQVIYAHTPCTSIIGVYSMSQAFQTVRFSSVRRGAGRGRGGEEEGDAAEAQAAAGVDGESRRVHLEGAFELAQRARGEEEAGATRRARTSLVTSRPVWRGAIGGRRASQCGRRSRIALALGLSRGVGLSRRELSALARTRLDARRVLSCAPMARPLGDRIGCCLG